MGKHSKEARKHFENIVEGLRCAGWDASLDTSSLGYGVRLRAADGGRDLFANSLSDCKALIVGGQVERRS